MKSFLSIIYFGIGKVLKQKKYLIFFILLSLIMILLYILIPVWLVPGNTIESQLNLFTTLDYSIIVALSTVAALFIVMQSYVVIHLPKKAKDVGTTVGGSLGAIFAGVTGTAFCASCLAPIFAIFGIGFGGVLFILEYRLYFVVGILFLLLLSIYLVSRKIKGICNTC